MQLDRVGEDARAAEPVLTSMSLRAMIEKIWLGLFGLSPAPVPEPDWAAIPALTGVVPLAGEWQAVVMVRCSARLARRSAASMFMVAEGEVSDEQVHDGLGELANVAAGHVKELLGGSCHLGLPAVTSGLDYRVQIPRADLVERVALACEGEPLTAAVYGRHVGAGLNTQHWSGGGQ